METYKIGNKVNAIIRAYCPCTIGDEKLIYANQPYTILRGKSANITFEDHHKQNSNDYGQIFYHNMNNINTLTISDVELTDKILNLIFSKSEIKLAHNAENYNSSTEKEIFINTSANTIYQVFIYNQYGKLENMYEEWDTTSPLVVKEPLNNYLIIYSIEKEKAYNLNNYNNIYLTIDLELTGNIDSETSTMWLHLDKCGIRVDKDLYFTQQSNAVDIVFKIINDKTTQNYITVQ